MHLLIHFFFFTDLLSTLPMTDPHRRDTASEADSSDETIIYTYDHQQHSTYGETDADVVSIKGMNQYWIRSCIWYNSHAMYRCC